MQAKEILDTSVVYHNLPGAITIFSVVEYPPAAIGGREIIFPENNDYFLATTIANKLRVIGKPVGAIDMIIAAMCMNRNATLVTKDKDFKAIKSVCPSLNLLLKK